MTEVTRAALLAAIADHRHALGERARVAFVLTGDPEGLPGRATLETHHQRTYRVVHVREDGQHAAFYQLANHDERYFSLAVYYDETATNPKAMAVVLDHILGSVQDAGGER